MRRGTVAAMLSATPPTPLAHAELRRAIADRGESIAAAAARLGCTTSYLSRVLRGEHVPTDPFRYRAERLYGVIAWHWDPRSIDRDALIRQGYRPRALARQLGLRPSDVLAWWRGGDVPRVAAAVAPLLAGAS